MKLCRADLLLLYYNVATSHRPSQKKTKRKPNIKLAPLANKIRFTPDGVETNGATTRQQFRLKFKKKTTLINEKIFIKTG